MLTVFTSLIVPCVLANSLCQSFIFSLSIKEKPTFYLNVHYKVKTRESILCKRANPSDIILLVSVHMDMLISCIDIVKGYGIDESSSRHEFAKVYI